MESEQPDLTVYDRWELADRAERGELSASEHTVRVLGQELRTALEQFDGLEEICATWGAIAEERAAANARDRDANAQKLGAVLQAYVELERAHAATLGELSDVKTRMTTIEGLLREVESWARAHIPGAPEPFSPGVLDAFVEMRRRAKACDIVLGPPERERWEDLAFEGLEAPELDRKRDIIDRNGKVWRPCEDPGCPDSEHPEDLHSHQVTERAKIEPPAMRPGDILLDYMAAREMDRVGLARHTGIDIDTVSGVLSGSAPITPMIAAALGEVFERPTEFWLNLQSRYDKGGHDFMPGVQAEDREIMLWLRDLAAANPLPPMIQDPIALKHGQDRRRAVAWLDRKLADLGVKVLQ